MDDFTQDYINELGIAALNVSTRRGPSARGFSAGKPLRLPVVNSRFGTVPTIARMQTQTHLTSGDLLGLRSELINGRG